MKYQLIHIIWVYLYTSSSNIMFFLRKTPARCQQTMSRFCQVSNNNTMWIIGWGKIFFQKYSPIFRIWPKSKSKNQKIKIRIKIKILYNRKWIFFFLFFFQTFLNKTRTQICQLNISESSSHSKNACIIVFVHTNEDLLRKKICLLHTVFVSTFFLFG